MSDPLMRGCLWLLLCAPLWAQNPAADFFEKQIRPVLASKCYAGRDFRLTGVHGEVIKKVLA